MIIKYCVACGKEINKNLKPSLFNTRIFCSHDCANKFRSGSKHPMWKGGKSLTGSKYILLRASLLSKEDRDKYGSMITKKNTILEHRLVAAKKIGRPLTQFEIVHHLNGDKTDNRPENLIVLTRKEHNIEHYLKEGLLVCPQCGFNFKDKGMGDHDEEANVSG